MAQPERQLDVVHSPASSPILDSMLLEDDNQPNHNPDNADNQTGSSSKKSTDDSMAPVPMSVDNTDMELEPQAQPTQWDDLYSRMPLYGWFKVEDTVFCLDISRYAGESPYMASLYRDLQDHHVTKRNVSEMPKLGVLQSCPIVIEGISKEEVTLFMEFLKIHRGWNESPLKDKSYPNDQMMRCVELAQKWGLTSVERQFIQKLDIPTQSPAFRLYAAVKFKDESLLHGAVNTLVFTPLNKSQPDLSLLSFKVYRALTLARDAIMVQRAAIAAQFPTIPNVQDVNHRHDDCEIACDHLWQLHVTTDLLSSHNPAPNARESFLEALADRDDVNIGCKDHLRSDLTTFPAWEVAWGNESAILRQLRLKISRIIEEGGV